MVNLNVEEIWNVDLFRDSVSCEIEGKILQIATMKQNLFASMLLQ